MSRSDQMEESLDGSQSDESNQFERLHMEPIYDAFVCPLTKKVMRDPVTLENGQTFEREAIENHFKECRESGNAIICPVTSQELRSTDLNPSIAMRNTIEQWTARNEAAQLDMARRCLNPGSAESDILQALKFVQLICQRSRMNRSVVRDNEIIPMIIDMLKVRSRRVRYKALETLRIVVEEDADNKDILAEGDTVRTVVKFLSHELSKEREEAVSLLFELSKSEALCEKIGSINGAILILVGMSSSKSELGSTVDKAKKTLINLEKCEDNLRQMAENGRLQPLLANLLEGQPETKISMASHLGELVLDNDMKVLVARSVGSSLIDIMKSDIVQSREVSLKALNQISSFEGSAKVLIEAGIMPPLVKDLFTTGRNQLPMRLKEVAATILANLVNSGYDFDLVPVGPDHETLVSEEIVHKLLHLINNTGPAIACKLLQVLVGLTSSQKTVLSLVSAIKSSGAAISLVQFIDNDSTHKVLRLACIKLLYNLSPHMSQELADVLRGTVGQLASLVKVISEHTGITEEQAAAAGLLAELPQKDLSLTRQLLNEGSFQFIYQKVVMIQQGEIKGIRFMTEFLDGLVKVLARATFVLADEHAALAFCRDNNLAALFVDMLQANGLDGVQMVSATALENLSRECKNYSRLPELPPPRCCLLSWFSKPTVISGVCRLHRGICSLRETFCLLEGKAVEKLVALLDHRNEKVVEAALAALSTLLDDGVDIEQGVNVLYESEGIKPVLQVLQNKRTENLRRQAVWAVERILRTEDIASDISGDPNVGAALVDAFQNGDYKTKQNAERALQHVDKMPQFSGIFANMG